MLFSVYYLQFYKSSDITSGSTHVHCHLDYSCSSWYPSLNKGLKNKLQICQNKVVRFITGMGPRESVNYYGLAEMSLLNVESRNMQ